MTSFTVAHSVTLSLAALNIVSLPPGLVEAGIAFSVAYVALENLFFQSFDRRWMDDGRWIARLPQEDFCQATGTPARLKYEHQGGPGLRAVVAVAVRVAPESPQAGVALLANPPASSASG